MRTLKHITTGLLLLVSISISAQQSINYKAIVKDASGNLIANDLIAVQFIIYKGAALTNNVYQETHTPTTDANGMVILNIGEGTTGDTFSTIDWAADQHFLNVQINTGGGLVDMGTTAFNAVPYAKYAETATVKINDLTDGKSDDDGTDNGSSVFLGLDAGLNDDGSHNRSVGVGFEALYSNTSQFQNTAVGYLSLRNNALGNNNTASGAYALSNNTDGFRNTAGGAWALYNNLTGADNVAYGYRALHSNTETSGHTAIGFEALFNNNSISAIENTAVGYRALYSNTEGYSNTANGFHALYSNTEGDENTANGHQALFSNTDGDNNTAIGYQALFYNEGKDGTSYKGSDNTASGSYALYSNTEGDENTANGYGSLSFNTTGGNNTATGYQALVANTTGSNNTATGYKALPFNTTGSNNTGIGNNAQVPDGTANNQVRIGNTLITYAGVQVAWTVTSDKRWKENIRELPFGLEVVKQLQPVDYMRKNNEHKTREMGFIAQDVEALLTKVGYADQGFLHKDDKGLMSLRYNDFIALLTKAIQEQQEIIEKQNVKLNSQDKNYEKLLKRVEQLELAGNQ